MIAQGACHSFALQKAQTKAHKGKRSKSIDCCATAWHSVPQRGEVVARPVRGQGHFRAKKKIHAPSLYVMAHRNHLAHKCAEVPESEWFAPCDSCKSHKPPWSRCMYFVI